MVAAVPLVLVATRPVEVQVSVEDSYGRAVEAVPVRVTPYGGGPARVFFTNFNGRSRFPVGGVCKRVDIVVAVGTDGAELACPVRPGDGLNYDAVSHCGIDVADPENRGLRVLLESHTSTNQICRLTGRGAATRPYDYEGQDSAITIPLFSRPGTDRNIDVLWWFGDTTTDSTREIYVSNKMAVSDPHADPAKCLTLDYIDFSSRGPLSVDPEDPNEATVWLDVPLVDHATSSRGLALGQGRFGFDPSAGDKLYLSYLSVEDTQPFFKITKIGLVEVSGCYPQCDDDVQGSRILSRVPGAVWDLPVQYERAPEGTAFLFDDTYTIIKVAPRRSYCANDPEVVDCNDDEPCPRDGVCVEPGKFCNQPPHVRCANDEVCDAGQCEPGGVVAMRVPAKRFLDKSAYRYWNAATRGFDKGPDENPDAFLVGSTIGNSVSIMWDETGGRWLMIHSFSEPLFKGMRRVGLRTSKELLGPWSDPVTIMENVAGQKSYNPRFVPDYEKPGRVYWTATFDTFGADEPMHAKPFDYNVFLYETDLTRLPLR
jgi:hypothetical protein